ARCIRKSKEFSQFWKVPGSDHRIWIEKLIDESRKIELTIVQAIGKADSSTGNDVRSCKWQRRVASIPNAGDSDCRAVGISRPHSQVEIASRKYLKRARTADLDIARERYRIQVQGVTERLRDDSQRRVRIESGKIAPRRNN